MTDIQPQQRPTTRRWRLQLLVDTDEAGITHARKACLELLQPVFGEVKTVTIEEDAFRLATMPSRPLRVRGVEDPEHVRVSVNGRRRTP